MKNIVLIPARMGSSRFPGKPLKEICGISMIAHIWKRSKMAQIPDDVYIATCDQEIFDHMQFLGAKIVMTKSTHERCSDRCAEAMLKIEKNEGIKINSVCMVQGDEPLVTPEMIDSALEALLQNPSLACVNLMGHIYSKEELQSPNSIKVVTDLQNRALYFSRQPIPYKREIIEGIDVQGKKQVCIIPFWRNSLLLFNDLAPTPLEKQESVDMLRFIEHGHFVQMVPTEAVGQAVDTPEDLQLVENIMKNDPIFLSYKDESSFYR